MDQLFYTIPDCCQLASVGRTKFYELIASGQIPIRKLGKKSLVAAADLKRWADRLPAVATKQKPADRTNAQAMRLGASPRVFSQKGAGSDE